MPEAQVLVCLCLLAPINDLIYTFSAENILLFHPWAFKSFGYDGTHKGIQAKHASKLVAILDRLDAANEIKDMNYPGSGLHPLLPKTKRRWAIKVSGNWRLTFEFIDGDALSVDIEDYH